MSKAHSLNAGQRKEFDLYPQRNFRIVDQVKQTRISAILKTIEINKRKTNFFSENNLDFMPFVMERDGLGRLNKKNYMKQYMNKFTDSLVHSMPHETYLEHLRNHQPVHKTQSFMNTNFDLDHEDIDPTKKQHEQNAQFKLNSIMSKDMTEGRSKNDKNQNEIAKKYQWDLWTVSNYEFVEKLKDTQRSTTARENVFGNTNFGSTMGQDMNRNQTEESNDKAMAMTQRFIKKDLANSKKKMRETFVGVFKSPCLNTQPLDPVSSVVNRNWPNQKRISEARIMPIKELTQQNYDENPFAKVDQNDHNLSFNSQSNLKKNNLTGEQNSLLRLTQYKSSDTLSTHRLNCKNHTESYNSKVDKLMTSLKTYDPLQVERKKLHKELVNLVDKKPLSKEQLKKIKEETTSIWTTKQIYRAKEQNKFVQNKEDCSDVIKKINKLCNEDEIWTCKILFDKDKYYANINQK